MIWWPRQMPATGYLSAKTRVASMALVTTAGSPGPFERNTASGASAVTCWWVKPDGTTSMSKPSAASRRRMFHFTPKS